MKGDDIILAGELFGTQWTQPDCVIKGITCDSRRIKPGYVFVCLKGHKDSGYRYIKEAEDLGAVAIIADSTINSKIPVLLSNNPREKMAEYAAKIYNRPDEKMSLIGVTGTNGKTTVTHLIRDVIRLNNMNAGLIGTNGCYFNYRKLDEDFTTSTTPESAELYKILNNMYELGAKSVVMEVSSHALELKRVHGMKYKTGAFTNLTQDHLDFHKSMEKYFIAKSRLFEMSERCVINTDNEYGKRLYEKYKNKAVSYGFSNALVSAKDIVYSEKGAEFTLLSDKKNERIFINIPGSFSVYNALCAYAVCKTEGIRDNVIFEAFAKTKGVSGRAERVECDADFSIIIDYAHSPDGLINIIKAVKAFTTGKVITLFGCGGNRDSSKRAVMGRISGELSDFTIITSDNPRFEDPIKIIRDIESGIYKITNEYAVVPDRFDAIEYALKMAKHGDTVLLLGKGHEDYIIRQDKKIHFDEREVVKQILQK